MTAAKCLDCGERDPSKFYSHAGHSTGLQSRCKRCDNARRYQRQVLERRAKRAEGTR